jgi:glycosyltransferase involved in cell wall biosynthesis
MPLEPETGRTDLIRYYRVPAEKIQAIPLAIESSFRRVANAEIDVFKQRYHLHGKKIIGFLGSIFGRRHIRELIAAFGRLREKHDLALIIVGKNFAGREMTDWLNQKGIIWLEWLPEEQLNSFYSTLDLFVYISSYEGFGFPPLEALACGTVSLLLPSSSLQEMYQDLAIFVDSPEPEQLALAIDLFLDNQTINIKRISASWQKRKNFFSWSRVAADYLKTIFK